MAQLNWKSASPTDSSSSAPSASSANPWFAVSIGLMGLIVGFGIAQWRGSASQAPGESPSPIVQAPIPPPTPNPTPSPSNPASTDDDSVLGEEDSPVTLIEFVDYQCPFCKRFFDQTLSQIKTEYIDTGKVKLVMRDFPLSFHQNAQKTSEATECAGDEGKFWEMHDTLFQKQDEWASASNVNDLLKKYAADLGLSSSFDSCLDDGTYAQEVQKDFADGSSAGINGTPGFWVIGKDGKGQQISGAVPFQNFKTVIDSLLGPDA